MVTLRQSITLKETTREYYDRGIVWGGLIIELDQAGERR